MIKLTDTFASFLFVEAEGTRPCITLAGSTIPISSYAVRLVDDDFFISYIWIPKDMLDLTLLDFISMYRLGLITLVLPLHNSGIHVFINYLVEKFSNETY